MQSGKLRHKIRIERPVYTQDATTGDMVTTWTLFAKPMASVEPLSVKEMIAANAVQSQVSARIVIRHRDDITPDMRIVHRGETYNIEGLLPDQKSGLEYLTIPVSKGLRDV